MGLLKWNIELTGLLAFLKTTDSFAFFNATGGEEFSAFKTTAGRKLLTALGATSSRAAM